VVERGYLYAVGNELAGWRRFFWKTCEKHSICRVGILGWTRVDGTPDSRSPTTSRPARSEGVVAASCSGCASRRHCVDTQQSTIQYG